MRPTPLEPVLEVLPLYQPMAYGEARDALTCELVALAADRDSLSVPLDGGLTSLLACGRLATRALEEAIQRGDVATLG
jgi:hypothetical protein